MDLTRLHVNIRMYTSCFTPTPHHRCVRVDRVFEHVTTKTLMRAYMHLDVKMQSDLARTQRQPPSSRHPNLEPGASNFGLLAIAGAAASANPRL